VSAPAAAPLLEVRELSVSFGTGSRSLRAVRDVSFTLERASSLALVGESGSGKTTLLRSVVGLVPRAAVAGRVAFKGRDLTAASERELERLRGGEIGLVFQDPVSCFNPSLTVGYQLERVLRIHRPEARRPARAERIAAVLVRVGIEHGRVLRRHPFELSQGQLQRVMIAAACLSGKTALLLADEPTTSLDVTTEAQIIELLRDLRRDLDMALVLVTHNLAVAAQLCDRVLVMYGGRLVEDASVEALFERPAHPYTRRLLESLPVFPPSSRRVEPIRGEPASALGVAAGCPFAPRCDVRIGPVCDEETPPLAPTGTPGQLAACHLVASGSTVEPVAREARR
jgi:oligopeptide/dipeptide ABC transporter ATP-binding protein